jgi:hypothetical protein
MEIAVLPKGGVRIKGKQATLIVGSSDVTPGVNALLLYAYDETGEPIKDEVLVIDSPGDYEVSSVKISTFRNASDLAHSFSMDGIDVVIGKLAAMERMQSKLGEHQIVVLFADSVSDASFATNLVTNTLVFYGVQGKEVAEKVAKGVLQELSKYVVTMDKLPAEVETVLLT